MGENFTGVTRGENNHFRWTWNTIFKFLYFTIIKHNVQLEKLSPKRISQSRSLFICWIFYCIVYVCVIPRRGRSGLERRPRKRMVGARIPASIDLSRTNRKWQLHCQTLGNRCECHGSSEMSILNGCPVSQ